MGTFKFVMFILETLGFTVPTDVSGWLEWYNGMKKMWEEWKKVDEPTLEMMHERDVARLKAFALGELDGDAEAEGGDGVEEAES